MVRSDNWSEEKISHMLLVIVLNLLGLDLDALSLFYSEGTQAVADQ
jgi:hypothetical protein